MKRVLMLGAMVLMSLAPVVCVVAKKKANAKDVHATSGATKKKEAKKMDATSGATTQKDGAKYVDATSGATQQLDTEMKTYIVKLKMEKRATFLMAKGDKVSGTLSDETVAKLSTGEKKGHTGVRFKPLKPGKTVAKITTDKGEMTFNVEVVE